MSLMYISSMRMAPPVQLFHVFGCQSLSMLVFVMPFLSLYSQIATDCIRHSSVVAK